MSIIYLRKAGDDVICHCKCSDCRVAGPTQLDCPWCGCGWLFSCISCRKAFTFAEGVKLDTSWEELMREDLKRFGYSDRSDEQIAERVEAMQVLLKNVQVGERYVYLDGWVLPANAKAVDFDGWHSHHHFEVLPHYVALDDNALLDKMLGNRDYWMANAIDKEGE